MPALDCLYESSDDLPGVSDGLGSGVAMFARTGGDLEGTPGVCSGDAIAREAAGPCTKGEAAMAGATSGEAAVPDAESEEAVASAKFGEAAVAGVSLPDVCNRASKPAVASAGCCWKSASYAGLPSGNASTKIGPVGSCCLVPSEASAGAAASAR